MDNSNPMGCGRACDAWELGGLYCVGCQSLPDNSSLKTAKPQVLASPPKLEGRVRTAWRRFRRLFRDKFCAVQNTNGKWAVVVVRRGEARMSYERSPPFLGSIRIEDGTVAERSCEAIISPVYFMYLILKHNCLKKGMRWHEFDDISGLEQFLCRIKGKP